MSHSTRGTMAKSELPDESPTSVVLMQEASEVASPLRPVMRKKATKGRSNLRKSLAWNEAFFTDEGVLDVDELQIVAKTPKRPLQLPLIEVPELPRPPSVSGAAAPSLAAGLGAAQDARACREIEKSLVGAMERGDDCIDIYDLKQDAVDDPEESLLDGEINTVCKQVSVTCISSAGFVSQESCKDGAQAVLDQGYRYGSHPVSNAITAVPVAVCELPVASDLMIQNPVQSVIGAAMPTGTRLRLPGSFAKDIHVERDVEDLSRLPPLPSKGKLQRSQSAMVLPASSASLSKRVSSMSRKVKEALGKVMPGRSTKSNKAKEALEKSSTKQPLSITLPGGPIDASPKLTSGHVSSPFNRSGRHMLPESSSMLTRQKSLNAVPSSCEKSSKVTTAHASSPFNRSGRNMLPEASGMSSRHETRTTVHSEGSAKLSSGYAASPSNRCGRNMLPESVPVRQQENVVVNGPVEASKLFAGASSSPGNRSGRNVLSDVSGVANKQQVAMRILEASTKATSHISRSGRNLLPEISKASSGQVRGTTRAPHLANENPAKLTYGHSSSPLNRSGRIMIPECSTVLSRSTSSKSNCSSAGGTKLSSYDVPATKTGAGKLSATTCTISRTKGAPKVISKGKSDESKPHVNAGNAIKAGESSRQTSACKRGSGSGFGEKLELNASSGATSGSKTKPSGLRLPTPKFGFFESVRANPSSTLPDKPMGSSNIGRRILPPRAPDSSGRSRLPSVASGRVGTDFLAAAVHARVQSNIPAAPHLRGSDSASRYKPFSVSAPTSPHRSTLRTVAVGADQSCESRISSPPSKVHLSPDRFSPAVLDGVPEDARFPAAASSSTEAISIQQRINLCMQPSSDAGMPSDVRQGDSSDAGVVCRVGPSILSNCHIKDFTLSSIGNAASSVACNMQYNGGSLPDIGSPGDACDQALLDLRMSLAEPTCAIDAKLSNGDEVDEPCESGSEWMGSNGHWIAPLVAGSVSCYEPGPSACQPGVGKDNGSRVGEAAALLPLLSTKVIEAGKEALGRSQGSSCGESVESPSHWVDWHKFKERTPDSQKIHHIKGEGAKSVSPVQLLHNADSSPTSSSGEEGPRLVRCTSSPMILNGRSPLGPSANAVPKRRESRSFFSLARKAVSRLTTSPNSGKAGQENDNANKQPSAVIQKGRRLSKAGQEAQQSAEIADQLATDKLPEDAGDLGGPTSSNAVVPDIKKLSPFTEEWIAAVEAAGQEALEMKSGSVQNSPPNKTSSSKSNPWSPVRRTAGLGPFDCTKRCS